MFKSILLLIFITISYGFDDEYISEKYKICKTTQNSFDCFKYRAVKYLLQFENKEFIQKYITNYIDPLKIVKINNKYNITDIGDDDGETLTKDVNNLFGEIRQLNDDSEFQKLIKFLKRTVMKILQTYAVQIPLSNDKRTLIILDGNDENEDQTSEMDSNNEIDSSTTIGEMRGRKKKKLQLLLPLLALLKLFKIKILLIITVIGVVLIKKMLLGAALILPSILNSLKMCKHLAMPIHGIHHDHYGSDYVGDYGFSGTYSPGYSGGQIGGYGAKDYGGGGGYERIYKPS